MFPAGRTHIFWPMQRVSNHTLVKPAPHSAIFYQKRPVFKFYKIDLFRMFAAHSVSGLLKHIVSNWTNPGGTLYKSVSVCRNPAVNICTFTGGLGGSNSGKGGNCEVDIIFTALAHTKIFVFSARVILRICMGMYKIV